ncbi:hypothetical protein [Henriciella sp.]|uniref:hypothetical protein n=1 Tax=Henriciella sp. TaxID=1968823 RepID=UPI0025C2DF71|nr:hypothetical protein [Henriciella sp.]
MSEGLGLIVEGFRKLRLAVEIERTLKDTSEPDGTGDDGPARLSPCAQGVVGTQRNGIQ